ncbi:hypothetical protein EVAR_39858_1 [Eumeta japonica]|uniref:Uncharacterized protein n=1 Tax=Eumeta variegata TaxID=151549 RepID=A0A4C1WUI8_EUMVA|nr:hypothetical protein EVAR_39858_1 [Eumeta japonica]
MSTKLSVLNQLAPLHICVSVAISRRTLKTPAAWMRPPVGRAVFAFIPSYCPIVELLANRSWIINFYWWGEGRKLMTMTHQMGRVARLKLALRKAAKETGTQSERTHVATPITRHKNGPREHTSGAPPSSAPAVTFEFKCRPLGCRRRGKVGTDFDFLRTFSLTNIILRRAETRTREVRFGTLNVYRGKDDKINDVCEMMKVKRLDILYVNKIKRKSRGGAIKYDPSKLTGLALTRTNADVATRWDPPADTCLAAGRAPAPARLLA